ncbi:MAG TPA: hypothetical protein VFN68_05875 [Acidimicrobiales bacterium]|nr:hypothetical protein [Acidimicrobiales bacterium]
MASSEEPGNQPELARLIDSVHQQLRRVEQFMGPETGGADRHGLSGEVLPAWRRATRGEHRLPVVLAVAVAIALQLVLPDRLVIHPSWLLPSLEGLLAAGLLIANPGRIDRTSTVLRTASVVLIVLISVANAWSSAELINGLLNGKNGDNASLLLARGASIYITNILVFALWYWEWDGGGPVARTRGTGGHPDFLFPQMVTPEAAPPGWKPKFPDYLYVSFTNATAFSPTDTMPLSRWAKMLMLVQSAVALATIGLVIARAVNVLK